jgi:hypothetical protein
MRYESPAVESRQPIAQPLVLGTSVSQIASPTWSDKADEDTQDR